MSGELEGAARSYSTTSGSNVTEKRGTPKTQILDVKTQIQKISNEIARCIQLNLSSITVDENDLSLIKLEEYWTQLQALETEKSDRLYKVIEYLNTVHGLCSVLGLDFLHMITEVHPSLDEAEQFRSVSNETIENLAKTIHALQEEKKKRMQKLQDLVTTMLELWNLMDTPMEEQQMFQNVTRNIAASEHEICAPTALVLDFVDYAEAEVVRLEELKESKMKELVLKKQTELEEICRRTYLLAEANTEIDKAIASMDSGVLDPLELLEGIERANCKNERRGIYQKGNSREA